MGQIGKGTRNIFAIFLSISAILGYLFVLFPTLFINVPGDGESHFLNYAHFDDSRKIFALIVINFSTAFLFHRFYLRYILYEGRSWLPLFLFIFLLTPALPNANILLLLLAPLYTTLTYYLGYDKKEGAGSYEVIRAFNIMILISVISLFETDILFLVPMVWFQNIVYKEFTLKSFAASLIGLFVPIFLFYGSMFAIKGSLQLPKFTFSMADNYRFAANWNNGYLYFLVGVFLIFIANFFFVLRVNNSFNQSKRKVFTSTIIMFSYILLLMIVNLLNITSAYLLMVPLISMVISNYLNHSKKNAVIWVYIFLIVLYYASFIASFT